MKTVEALLPAWRAAGFIQATLDCLSAQTHGDFTVRVSVDQCDDETYAICARHAERDRRFRVVAQGRRLGYVGNCNFLLEQSRADYVLFAFHDDILAPTYLEQLAGALDAHPEAVLSYSDVELTHTDGRREHWAFTALDGMTSRVDRGLCMLIGEVMWWTPNRGMFRREPTRIIGGLKTHGAGEFSADWPWLFRLSLLGQFVRVPQTLCFKFYKPDSLSQTWAYSKEQYVELAAAHLREIWSSELTTPEKLTLAVPMTDWLAQNSPQPAKA
jgi:glycosyltransferase involved in cell wall biosynthesis